MNASLPRGLVAAADAGPAPRPLWLLRGDDLSQIAERWPEPARRWLEATGLEPKAGAFSLLPDAEGGLHGAVGIVDDATSPFEAGRFVQRLPQGAYALAAESTVAADVAALGWALECYRFRLNLAEASRAALLVVDPSAPRTARALRLAEGVRLARDLINTPANRLGPAELAQAAQSVAARFDAETTVTVGQDLLAHNYPAIFAVGQASARAPLLVDLRWGPSSAPKLTLVGKGVCFDTGGLDLKPSSNMLLMKKDMGGAALMLALAQTVMAAALPVRLRVLLPAVENSVAGNAFRPGDVIDTRRGLSVEIGNTDAEGRLILADALTEAASEDPDTLLDAATLTGAARVALGTDLPALFTPDEALAEALLDAGLATHQPLWRLPLFDGYRRLLDTPMADLSNTGSGRFGGAITAALFLQSFVEPRTRWAHLDIYGYNAKARPGRPAGGEATALMALYHFVEQRYGARG